MPIPKVGDPAPDFSGPADDGSTVALRALRGKNVVLYFYPKDDTPGCTIEACAFRDNLPRFHDLDAVILGVSPDSVQSHRDFKEKFSLPYLLVSDEDHAIADAYGVWGEKNLYGKKYWGNLRTTFLIDANGRIARVFEKVKPEGHADEVAEAVASLE